MEFETNNGGVSERLTLAQMFALSTGAVAADTPLLNMAQTWNAGGVTFTGWKLNVTDTASAAGSLLLNLQVGGTSKFKVDKAGSVTAAAFYFSTAGGLIGGVGVGYSNPGWLAVPSSGSLCFGSSGINSPDIFVWRDGPNALGMRNGTSGQFFSLYGTYTDASNWERLYLQATVSGHYVYGDKLGTGVARFLQFGTNNLGRWRIGATDGHWVAVTDNAYDIGASGNRPRNLFLGGYLSAGTVAGGIVAGDVSAARNATTGALYLGSDGSCYIFRDGGTNLMFGGYTTLQVPVWCRFGGTTASYPSLKRNATELHARLADDSDFALLRGKLSTHAAAVTETITPDSTLILHDSNGTAYKVPCVAV